MLSCHSIGINYEYQPVINNFSITLLPGSINIIHGCNGSGKTTLLKAIASVISIYSGNIFWNNKLITNGNYPLNAITYLGHDNALKEKLSVIENLMFWADLRNTQNLVMPALAHFGLLDFAHLKCSDLSQGIQRKAALARLIIANCQLWLLDEPESHLDTLGKEFLLKLLQVKVNNGGIVLIASHDNEIYYKIPKIDIQDFKYVN